MKKVAALLVMVTLLLGIASVGFAAPTDDGLVLYYSFDGSDAKNQASSGSALDGVVTGVEFVDGVSGKAASFNADDSSNIVFNMTSGLPSFTISFWYQVPEIIEDEVPYALLCSSAWDANAVHCHITDGVVRAAFNGTAVKYSDFETNKYGKTKGREAEVNFPLTQDYVGKWINFTVTYDNPTKTRNFYMNGTLVSQDVADSVASTDFLIGEMQIGSWRADPARYFTGLIDEMRIYNRAISAEEVNGIVAVNAQAVSIPEPTPTPEATATPTPTPRPVTPTPTIGQKETNTPAASEEATKAPADTNGGNAIVWIIIGVVVVAVAVAAVRIINNKKKNGSDGADKTE